MSKDYDFSKLSDSKAYTILRPLGKALRPLFFKVKYTGVENIPQEGGFVLASNHIHAIDPMMIGLGIPKRQLHFMAKKELFDNPFVAWAFTTVNGFPIARGGADSTAFRYAVRIPTEGYILGIFPEGTRSKTGVPGKPKRGVATIASQAKCGILPVAIFNDEGIKKRSKYTVRFGELIPYEKLGLSENATKEEQIACADMVMEEIMKLWEQGHCE